MATNLSLLNKTEIANILTNGSYTDAASNTQSLQMLLADNNFRQNPNLYAVAKRIFEDNSRQFKKPSTDKNQSMFAMANAYSVITNHDLANSPLHSSKLARFFLLTTFRHNRLVNRAETLFANNLSTYVAVKRTQGEVISATTETFLNAEKSISLYLESTKKCQRDWLKLRKNLVRNDDGQAKVDWKSIKQDIKLNDAQEQIVFGEEKLSDKITHHNAFTSNNIFLLDLFAREETINRLGSTNKKIAGLWLRTQVAIDANNQKLTSKLVKSLYKEIKADKKASPAMIMAETLREKSPQSAEVSRLVDACMTKKSLNYLKIQEQRIQAFFNGATTNEMRLYASYINRMDEDHIRYFNFLIDHGITFADFSNKWGEASAIDNVYALTTGKLIDLNNCFDSYGYEMIKVAAQKPTIPLGELKLYARLIPLTKTIDDIENLKKGKSKSSKKILDAIKTNLTAKVSQLPTPTDEFARRKYLLANLIDVIASNPTSKLDPKNVLRILESLKSIILQQQLDGVVDENLVESDSQTNGDNSLKTKIKEYVDSLPAKIRFTPRQMEKFKQVESHFRALADSANPITRFNTPDALFMLSIIDTIKAKLT